MTSHESWEQISEQEWQRRLAEARALALRRLARVGINVSADDAHDVPSVAGLILDSPEGAGLLPQLADAQALAIAAVDRLGNPRLDDGTGDTDALSDVVYTYAMNAAEAGYLFGVIVGAQTSWPVAAGMQAPYAPPATTRRKKGGAQ